MEAISYGLPLISTNVSGIPEICINNFNGYLIEERNTNDIVNAILKLVESKNDFTQFKINSLKLSNEYDILENSERKIEYLDWK